MRTRQMKYLLTISRAGSISKAAKDLGISSQALGEAVRSLEEEMGLKLLEKTYRGTALTEAGHAFAEVSDVYFSNLGKIHQKYAAAYEELKQIDCVAMPHIVSMVMPKLIAGFYKKHPEIMIKMEKESDPDKIFKMVLNRKAEMAFITFMLYNGKPIIGDMTELLTFTPLWETKMYCLLPTSWSITCAQGLSIKDLSDRTMIVTENPASHKFTERLVHENDFQGKIMIENNYFIIREMIHEGLGFFITAFLESETGAFFDWQCNDDLQIVLLKDDIQTQIGYILKNNVLLSDSASFFLNFLHLI